MSARLAKWGEKPFPLTPPRFIDMKIGQLARIVSPQSYYNGHIVLRMPNRVINLTEIDSWSDLEKNTITVEILPPGSVVELTQEG